MGVVSSQASGGVAVVTISNPPVNALSAAVRAGLVEAVERLASDPGVIAIVLAAEGRAFVAGADIAEFGRPPVPPSIPEVLSVIEASGKPVVAAINGTALGGGLELVLACHARIAVPGAKLGLPEIKLGFIPGAGGTQRLPRLIGAAPAFEMMRSGGPVTAEQALAAGFVDALADGDVVAAAIAHAEMLADGDALPLARDRIDRLGAPERDAFEAAASKSERQAAEMPNVASLIEAVRAVFTMPFDEGLAFEREHFKRLVVDDRSKALRHVFFAEREAAKVPGLGKDVAPRRVERVAIVGAGTMGGGIAAAFADAGIPVTLIETEPTALDRGLARIAKTYEGAVGRGSLSAQAREERIALVEGRLGLEHAASADLVIEAAFEEMAVKCQIFAGLDRIVRTGAILATNTSYLDIDAIAASTGRPGDVVGLHFFSPANVMRLLEVVRGTQTAPDVLATALTLGRRLNKVPVVVGNCFGFVGNRMLSLRTLAAERLLVAGAFPHEVDAAVTGFGFRMGPFAMADLAGLDIGWRTRKSLGTTAPVADALCEAGRFGQKTAKGYYLYPEGERRGRRDREVEDLILAESTRQGIARRSFSADEIVARLMHPMVNEGARILEEGIATRPGDIDVVWINGYNWPAWRGGPMHWADAVGLATIAESLERQAAETGDKRLRPAPLLARLAREGRGFADAKAAA